MSELQQLVDNILLRAGCSRALLTLAEQQQVRRWDAQLAALDKLRLYIRQSRGLLWEVLQELGDGDRDAG